MPASKTASASIPDRIYPEERRAKSRYPLDLSVRFRLFGAESPFSGTGQLLNMSSGGALVASKYEVAVGALVEMRIVWPSLLDGKIPLQFLAVGRILRLGTSHFAASFERYQFRTMGSSSQSQSRLEDAANDVPATEPAGAAAR